MPFFFPFSVLVVFFFFSLLLLCVLRISFFFSAPVLFNQKTSLFSLPSAFHFPFSCVTVRTVFISFTLSGWVWFGPNYFVFIVCGLFASSVPPFRLLYFSSCGKVLTCFSVLTASWRTCVLLCTQGHSYISRYYSLCTWSVLGDIEI